MATTKEQEFVCELTQLINGIDESLSWKQAAFLAEQLAKEAIISDVIDIIWKDPDPEDGQLCVGEWEIKIAATVICSSEQIEVESEYDSTIEWLTT